MASRNHHHENKHDQQRPGSLLSGSTWHPSSGPYDTHIADGVDGGGGGGDGLGRREDHMRSRSRRRHEERRGHQRGSSAGARGDIVVGPTPRQSSASSYGASSSASHHEPTPNSLTGTNDAQRVRFSRAEYKAPVSLENSMDGVGGGVGVGVVDIVGGYYGRTPNSLDDANIGGGCARASAYREFKSRERDGRCRDVVGGGTTYDGGYVDVAASLPPARDGGGISTDDDVVVVGGGRYGGRDVVMRRMRDPERRHGGEDVVDFELEEGVDRDGESDRTPMERWASRRERKMRGRGGGMVAAARTTTTMTTTRRRTRCESASDDEDARVVVEMRMPPPQPAMGPSDDLVPAIRKTSIKNRGRSRWSPVDDGDEEDGYEERVGCRRPDDTDGSGDRGSDMRAARIRSDDIGESRRERSRPDPLGHRQSSIAVEADADNYTLESTESIHEYYGSPPVDGGMRVNVDAKGYDCIGNGSGVRSTYADDLKSFTESVAGAVTALRNDGSRKINVARNPSLGSRGYHGRRCNEMESGRGNNSGYVPEIGVPIFHNHSRVAPESLHGEDNNEGERRVRPRAKDFCKRLSVCEGIRTSASGKSDKKYIWISMSVCVACLVALSLTIHHLGKQASKEQEGHDSGWSAGETTEAPSISSMPSIQPTGAPTTGKPTPRPTAERERLIGEYVSSLSGGDSNEIESPQYLAKMWILYEDELNLHLPISSSSNQQGSDQSIGDWNSELAQRIKQRFALATMYYSMGIGEGDLVKGWLEGEECRYVGDYGRAWDGVGCDDDGHVRAVALDGANLHGTIPSEISLLSSIENLVIKNNPGLSGMIPHTIGNHMSQLRQLGLNDNSLTGTIPISTFRLSNLVYLNLGDNLLTGTIQWEEASHYLGKLERLILHNNQLEGAIDFHYLAKTPSLSLLSLSNNLFDGNIDETVGNLQSLEFLYLNGNKLEGSIPDSIGNLINLKSLNLDENGLFGTLPQSIGNLTSLLYFSAKSNAITGGLPASMKLMTGLKTLNLASNAMSGHLRHLPHMTSLKSIHLYQNSFTGSLDGQMFVTLPKLEILFLSSNSLTGGIPSELGGPHKILKGLYLSENNLKGGIPEELCELYKLEDLFVDSNNLEGTLPSCLASLVGLKRLYAFNNKFSGQVPDRLMNLPHLIEVGIEDNNLQGGIDQKTCEAVNAEKLSIWADCTELDGGCDCCERCCSDQGSDC